MIAINSPELRQLAMSLSKYDSKTTIARLAGLLTVPSLQANTFRLETAVHLAVAFCGGNLKPGARDLDKWLNGELGNSPVGYSEDSAEDVFVSNVETPEGNRRLFEGNWSSNDYFAQLVIEILRIPDAPHDCRDLLEPVFALLKLSDHVAERAGLQRWCAESSTPRGNVNIPSAREMSDRVHAVTFLDRDLEALDISRDVLAPFILRDEDQQVLAAEIVWHTSLERRPLVDFGNELVLALPHAVSPAIIRFVLAELLRLGFLTGFSEALREIQAQQIQQEGISDLRRHVKFVEVPEPEEGTTPPLHTLLFKHDLDKYIHVVLLHDRLDHLHARGLSSAIDYPQPMQTGLRTYLKKVADYCLSELGCTEGTTLLVLGGLGRGFQLSLGQWPNRQRLSLIRMPDLLMLASEPDRPLTRYLKCIKQRKWAEGEGVRWSNLGGDYNFYCCWRQSEYRLIPHELTPASGSRLVVSSDFMAPVREQVRKLANRHVLQIADGSYVPVRRFHTGANFKSLRERPIYASVSHLELGMLAGAVETSRGTSWLLVESMKDDKKRGRFHWEIWRSFIDLYDRLVFEAEALHPDAQAGPIAIYLDLRDVVLPDDYAYYQATATVEDPVVIFLRARRTAAIRFPPNFLQLFRQPENKGEKWLLGGVAKGLLGLLQEPNTEVKVSIIEDLTNQVISNSGLRILHAFDVYDPVEQLRETKSEHPIFLAPEDYAFWNLKLSDGCTPAGTGAVIASKDENNAFLHCVVKKIWGQLRKQLQQLDRASVIRQAIRVHEAVSHDRNHWRRTAQAVLALYSSIEDVFAVAEKRETDRAIAGLSARTLLEMAVCECPEERGRELSRWELDELIAKVSLLFQVAAESDAIHDDLVTPRIKLHPNGEYNMERSFLDAVVKPFLSAYERGGFKDSADRYSELYKMAPPGARTRLDEVYSPGLISAFRAEFGLTIDDAVGGFAELLDLAVECDSIAVEATLGGIKDRLASYRGFSSDTSEAFIRAFSIFHRPAWDKPPQGFVMRDIQPWRFSRRLSALVRPLLIFGKQNRDKVFYGVGSLRLGLGYLLSRIEEGHLPQKFFTSEEMKQYIGAVNDKKGHVFAQTVSDQLRETGWQTRVEVQMTELGAPAVFGDVDVLAWKPSGEIRIVECKRLQLARTFAEIAEICRRFRGEAKDELHKHLRRIAWIKANPAGLQPIVGFLPNPDCIDDRLVTNTHVPMTYLTSLPIESGKIGPLE